MMSMMKMCTRGAAATVMLAALGACATPYGQGSGNTGVRGSANLPVQQAPVRSGRGVIQSIELVRHGQAGMGGSGVGMGTIIGAVIGGLVGTQIGSGSGTTAATVIGAAGGGYAGYVLENQNQPPQGDAIHRLDIRMDDGGAHQSLLVSTNTDFRVGDRVRIDSGVVRRY